MNGRERLIELMRQAFNVSDDNYGTPNTEQVVDYLLENSVIVLPVKVGDTVYTVSKRDGIVAKMVVEISWKLDWAGTDLGWGLILSGKRSNNRYNVSNIGKTVFLTKEEAEKALKGGATNE